MEGGEGEEEMLNFLVTKEMNRLCPTNFYIHNYAQHWVLNLRVIKGETLVGKNSYLHLHCLI